MMKYWTFLWLILAIDLSAQQLDISIGAEKVILMNAKTGALLFEKNAHETLYPASTTKIATALYTLAHYKDQLESTLTAKQEAIASISPQTKKQSNYRSPAYWLETDGTHIGIKREEQFRLYDLLCAMLICSANDASNVIAQGMGGSIPNFMDRVNDYLKSLGCLQTHYNNPHGLHHPEHYTTAYDLALMTKAALKDPVFRKIVSMESYTFPKTNFEYERYLKQTNQLIRNGAFHYSKALGVKTGTTQAAGKNLVAAAEDNGRALIAVVMGHRGQRSDLYKDVINMFETAFSERKMRKRLMPKGAQNLTTKVPRARGKLKTYLPDGLYYDFYPSEQTRVKASIIWQIPPLPIVKDSQVGMIRLTDEQGKIVKLTPILAAQELKPSYWRQITFGSCLALLLIFFWRLRKKQARRPLF